MLVHAFDLVTLLVAGLMVGNELCVSAFINPVLQRLDAHAEAAATPAFARRLGRVMPFWYALTLLLTVALVWLHWQTPARPWLLAAAAVSAATIVLTLIFLVPRNNLLATEPQNLPLQQLRTIRNTWDTLHRIRIAALTLALLSLTQGILLCNQ